MDAPDRWAQIKRILSEALELPPEERRPFVSRTCRTTGGSADTEPGAVPGVVPEVVPDVVPDVAPHTGAEPGTKHRAESDASGRADLEAELFALLDANDLAEAHSESWQRGVGKLTASISEEDPALASMIRERGRVDRHAHAHPPVPGDSGSDAERALRPVTHIGRYPVAEELGRGGTGVVYRAYDPKLDRSVAIKLLSEAWLGQGELSRLLREARSLARFNHPNIATIYSFDETVEGRSFLVLELIEGETLAQRIRRGPIPLLDGVQWGVQIARALAAAHERGIVHRDLKPQNVMLDLESVVRVLDFGIAKVENELDPNERDLLGTLGYMSPEQIRGRVLDPRSDVFSFGLVLYECLTGRRAIEGRSLDALRRETMSGRVDLSALPEEVPEALVELLSACLAIDRGVRVRDMTEVVLPLQTIRDRLREGARLSAEGGGGRSGTVGDPDAGGLRGLASETPVHGRDRSSTIPRPVSRFVGRDREVEAVGELLAGTRLLTLNGPAGAGKSRLAIRVAEIAESQFADGVAWISLTWVSADDPLETALVASLGLPEGDGRSSYRTVSDFLRDREMLLVLDTCEHLTDGCAALLDRLLPECPGVRVLTTSLGRIGLPGERTYAVPSLDEGDALALFERRAREARPGFRITARDESDAREICRRLDHMPLAIELAAARVHAMRVRDILGHLDPLPADARKRIHAVYGWGYDLLVREAQHLLRRLSVFAGGWTLECAERICSDTSLPESEVLELLTALVEKSFVVYELEAEGDHEGRYRMLRTIQQYVDDRWEDAAEIAALRSRHLEHFLSRAEEAAGCIHGPDGAHWLDFLETEHENLLAGFRYAVSGAVDPELGLRLALALATFWQHHAHYGIARRSLERAIAAAPTDGNEVRRAKVHQSLARIASVQGDPAAAEEHFRSAEELGRSAGDEVALAFIALDRAFLSLGRGDWSGATDLIQSVEPVFEKARVPMGRALSASLLAQIAHSRGDLGEAFAGFERALSLFRKMGDRRGVASQLNGMADIVRHRGDLGRAEAMYEECLTIARDQGLSQGMAATLINLANLAMSRGKNDLALERIEQSLALAKQIGHRRSIASSLATLAYYRVIFGQYDAARASAEECLRLSSEIGHRLLQTHAVFTTGKIAEAAGENEFADYLFGASAATRKAIGALSDPRDESVSDEAREVGRHANFEDVVQAARDFLSRKPGGA